MSTERLLLDTVFIVGLLNKGDQHHATASQLLARVRSAAEVWVTDAVLTEVANMLASGRRDLAGRFIDGLAKASNTRVVHCNKALFDDALDLYRQRADKQWSLTDCISMVVMHENHLRAAVTADLHFAQAGYEVLMRA